MSPSELGAGVRQGDPLSSALYVLIIEPLLNLICTKLQGLGLQGGPTTHSVISFADDCTGLLHDLRHTNDFLGFVDVISLATCMRLNKTKTVLLPFKPWNTSSEPLRLELERLNVDVVGNSGRAKVLGIYYGPQLSSTDRLHHLLADMQARCLLWARRARTLRDQVLILQQVILPILWYSASVCHIPATGFTDQVNTLISRFVCKSKSTIALSKDWWFIPPSLGGLGLTPVSDMIHSLHLHMLCKVILAARDHSYIGVPTWVEPVIRLFDQAIQPWGKDFDILYAPVSGSPDYANSYRFSQLGAYWQSVLFIWNTRLRE